VGDLTPWWDRGLWDVVLHSVAQFLLVVTRLSGLMLLGPLFGQPSVPFTIRAGVVVALSLILTPALPQFAARGFDRIDSNADGWVTSEEIPDGLHDRWDTIRQQSQRTAVLGLNRDDYTRGQHVIWPTSLLTYVGLLLGELVLGLLLGLGTTIIMSGLQIAGQLIDQQAGFSLGEVFNPDFDSSGSVSGQMLFLLGMVVFLLIEPIDGHLLLLGTLVQTFETLPPGTALVSLSAIELLGNLIQVALSLGIRVAAPVMVMMSLADLTMGFLAHSVPQVNLQALGFAAKAALCLLILVLAVSGVGDLLAGTVVQVIEELRQALTLPTDPGLSAM
jgi:flagellar biosynthesis protein FliR